jgi:hypothetical protein
MTIRKNTVSRLLAAVGMTAVVVAGAVTPSSAASTKHARHAGAYDARAYDARAYAGRASVALPRSVRRQRSGGGYFAHGAPDDPPGSAFQTFGNDRSMGMVR